MIFRQFFRGLITAIVTGAIAYVLFFFVLKEYTFYGDATERAQDMVYRLKAGQEPVEPGVRPFLFLDIDTKTFASLEYPTLTPRDKLAEAAGTILRARPALLFVDIDLSWRGDPEKDRKFADFLKQAGASGVPILLLKNPLPAPEGKAGPVFRQTPFDGIVASSPNIHWVTVEVLQSGDGIVRRAALFKDGCSGGSPLVVPGASLLAYAILSGGLREAGNLVTNLQKAAEPCTEQGAGKESTTPQPIIVEIAGSQIRLHPNVSDHQVRYSMWPKPPEGLRRPQVEVGGAQVDVLITNSAYELFSRPRQISSDPFRDSVVIIGSSAPELRDTHLTPLGEMAGALIVANHIRGLLEHGFDETNVIWWQLLIGISFSVVTYFIWLPLRARLKQRPFLSAELFKLAAAIAWFVLLANSPLQAFAFGVTVIQYLTITVLMVLNIRHVPSSQS